MTEIDLKATLEHTKGRIKVSDIASYFGMGSDAIRKTWIKKGVIPKTKINRLIEILENNEVKIYYK